MSSVPVFDAATAKSVTPYLHEKSGRTVANHQPAGDQDTHLFSATGSFIDTVPAGEASAAFAAALKAKAEREKKAEEANLVEHTKRVSAATAAAK